MRHISLFEVLAGRMEDLSGIEGWKCNASDYQRIERVMFNGRYEQLDEINGHKEPPFWRSVDNYDGFLYSPDSLPEDIGAPKYDAGGFGPVDIQGPVIKN